MIYDTHIFKKNNLWLRHILSVWKKKGGKLKIFMKKRDKSKSSDGF
jgi:hypothetical protein